MRFFLSPIITFLTIQSLAYGQSPKPVTCDKRYYNNKKLSLEVCMDMDGREGYAIVYNKKGEEVLKWNTRTYAGHASAYFKYHANGGVRVAEYSTHPDGGIQWYREKLDLDEEGNVMHRWVDQYPSELTTFIQREPVVSPPSPPISEVVVQNSTSKDLHLVITDTIQNSSKVNYITIPVGQSKVVSFLAHKDTLHDPLLAYNFYKVNLPNSLEGAIKVYPIVLEKIYVPDRRTLKYMVEFSKKSSKKITVGSK